MKRFRVESRISKDNFMVVDCIEEDLEYFKALCKHDALKYKGKCFYREFPVTKNPRVYYAKNNPEMTLDELNLMKEYIEKRSDAMQSLLK